MICHQFKQKQNTLLEDRERYPNITINLKDCVFEVTTDHKAQFDTFIRRYEWLGKMSNYPTHYFTLSYDDILVCLVVMDMPTAFSTMLGENTRKLERLISRGASISIAPTNTASFTISRAMKWMTQNTPYRLFTAYSDPEAGELGTIYQSLNFYYLGSGFGTKLQYWYNGRWTSDRAFRSRSAYKRYAKNLSIPWRDSWSQGDKIFWENVPDDIRNLLKEESKRVMSTLEKRVPPEKHKYAYILGSNKRETRELRYYFEKHNKTYNYPTERGK